MRLQSRDGAQRRSSEMHCGTPAQALRRGRNERKHLVHVPEARQRVVGERAVFADHAGDRGRESILRRGVELPLEDRRYQFADGAALRRRVAEHLRDHRTEPFVQGGKRRIVRLPDLDALSEKPDRGERVAASQQARERDRTPLLRRAAIVRGQRDGVKRRRGASRNSEKTAAFRPVKNSGRDRSNASGSARILRLRGALDLR